MSHRVIVHGFIESSLESCSWNTDVLREFGFDRQYPFPNTFAPPMVGFRSAVIAFASSYKYADDFPYLWRIRFESLLGALAAWTATVHFEHEDRGVILTLSYVAQGSSTCKSTKKWSRWTEEKEDDG